MADLRTICYYAMYVIGEVESNWNWTAVNYNDPITIGMMQWYGTRAAGLLKRIENEMPEAYALLASSLREDLSEHPANDSWWTARYLNQAEGNSIVNVFSSEQNHIIQENQAIEDFTGYISLLESWGMSQSNPKPLIFAMSMYHQSPQYCGQVMSTAGGSADLQRVYDVCLNHPVLGNYRNRYNTVYARLNAWDGESMPPDFGQSGSGSTGGNEPGIGVKPSGLNYIERRGSSLVLYGDGDYKNGVLFYQSAPNHWTCGYNADGTDIGGGNTGGGSETGTEAEQKLVQNMRDWVDRFAYSQGSGRLSPETSGYTDCSGLVWYDYHIVTGIPIGTWTGEQIMNGVMIEKGSGQLPIAEMKPGDLVFINWNAYNPTYDHVEMYMGNNELWGHGGPDNGPDLSTKDAENYPLVTGMHDWMVRRYL